MKPTYHAAVCTSLTGPSSIQILEQEVRPLQAGEVRVAIQATGLNFPDLLMTQGKYQFRPDPPFIPGLECAGEIIEMGSDVAEFKIGDRVMAGGKGNCLAEQLVVDARAAKPLPAALSFAEGACWQTAAATAWNALIEGANLQPGETVLILGASGGVGMAAVKLAKHQGAIVIGTGSTAAKRDAISAAGADHIVDPSDPDLAKKVKKLTGGDGVNVVYDPVGGDLAITATRAIAWGGRYLVVGFASGTIPSFPANHALIKAYRIIGIRAGESPRRDPDLARRQNAALAALAEKGVMKPHISHQFDLAQTSEALRALENRAVVGRCVILMAT